MWCRGTTCFLGMESRKPTGQFFDYIDIDAVDNRSHRVIVPKRISTSNAPSRASRAVQTGSVLFSLVRPYLENIALIDENYAQCIASTGFYVCNSNGILLPQYMFYMMISRYVVSGLTQHMKGDNSPSIRQDDVENWIYPIPPRNEQNRICQVLEEVFGMFSRIDKSLN